MLLIRRPRHENAVPMPVVRLPSDAPLRLFLGLWPPPEVHEALIAQSAAWDWPAAARRTRPERLHVTLHFLGDVEAGRLPQLRTGLQVPWQGAELVLDRATVWPGGIAVLEAARVDQALADLHARLAGALRALELPVESRPWRPHVTLARKAFGAHPPQHAPAVAWRMRPAYALVRSLPGGQGYETVAVFGG
jgi:RNA 2',3'-cyclic 3'-phosphodiesterase